MNRQAESHAGCDRTGARRAEPADVPPSQRQLLAQFAPLALSGVFFPLLPPVINAALARTPEPALALAALGLMRSLSQPLLSPLFGMRQVTTALARDRNMLGHVRQASVALAVSATVLLLLLCAPPLYRLVVERWMGIPPAVARIAWPGMLVIAFTPMLGIARGYYQGVLVHYRHPGPIGLGALGYLLGASLVVWPGVVFTRVDGALLGALAYTCGQVMYLLVIAFPARRVVRARVPERNQRIPVSQRSVGYILMFFLPLAAATVLNAMGDPLMQTAMAHARKATSSLAAFSVCTSVLFLAAVPLWNVQQVVIAQVRDHASYLQVRRFVLRLGAAWTLALMLVAWTPLSRWIFGDVIGVSGEIQDLSVRGFRWLAAAPLLLAGRSLFYGVLISRHATPRIRSAAFVRVAVLALALVLGVWLGRFPGLLVALWAMLLAAAVEFIWLERATARHMRAVVQAAGPVPPDPPAR